MFCIKTVANIERSELSKNNVVIENNAYDRIVYFSKMCAITNCMSYNQLQENITFFNGGCPSHLKFCSDINSNKAANNTYIESIILAKDHELGTGYIAIDHMKRVIILAFRGSHTRWDWYHDFLLYGASYQPASQKLYQEKIKKGEVKECIDCKVHAGFNGFLKTLHVQFMERLENIFKNYTDYSLVITGHSLGAAVAVLAGIEFKLRGLDPTIITYAQPKIFNSNMIEWINDLFEIKSLDKNNRDKGYLNLTNGYYRIVHENDYITDLPPYFRHAGIQVDINKVLLPHQVSDISYNGLDYYYSTFEKHSKKNNDTLALIKITNINKNTIQRETSINFHQESKLWESLPDDWLHLYEHRNYFIQINECDFI
ncbi:hypothetical protein QEN19_000804 [Hanseniaspora menglaensis]